MTGYDRNCYIDHAIIDWKIQNPCFLNLYNNNSELKNDFRDRTIKSGIFSVGTHEKNYWEIILSVIKIADSYVLSVKLRLCKIKFPYAALCGTFKLTLEKDGVRLFNKQYTYTFKNGDVLICENIYSLNLLSLYGGITDTFHNIICEMIYTDDKKNTTYYIDTGLNLSKDNILCLGSYILDAYKNNLMTDVTLLVDGRCIQAHRAILSVRSSLIPKCHNPIQPITLPVENFEAMNKVMEFIYSGDYNYLAYGKPPSLEMYEYAERFQISDLKNFLTPTEINIQSFNTLEKHKYTWVIDNIENYENPVVAHIGTILRDISWKICNSPVQEKMLKMDIKWTFTECSSDLIIKVSFLDKQGNVVDDQQNVIWDEPDVESGKCVFYFDKSAITETFMEQSNLKVNLEVLHPALNFSKHDETKSNVEYSVKSHDGIYNNHNNFSRDMLSIYENKIFTDVKLVAENTVFETHKFVLSARSAYFKCMFSEYTSRSVVGTISNLDQTCVETLLKYIYSGCLKVHDSMNYFEKLYILPEVIARDIYKAADFYMIYDLKRSFFAYWRQQIFESSQEDKGKKILDFLVTVYVCDDRPNMIDIIEDFAPKIKNLIKTQEWADVMTQYPGLNEEFNRINNFKRSTEIMNTSSLPEF